MSPLYSGQEQKQYLITWNEQTSRWFIEASAYTGFHKALAQKIISHLDPGDTLCDICCGLGRLDLEIAPYISKVHAIDVSEYATTTLRQDTERAGISNLQVLRGDAAELQGSFDIILISLYNGLDMPQLLRHCRRKMIRIVSAGKKSGLYPERHRRVTKNAILDIRNELAMLGATYSLEYCSLEFGQPLRTWRDAELFVLSNAPDANPEEIHDFLSTNIKDVGHGEFPFYLPYLKELGIFIIEQIEGRSCLLV